MRSFDSLTDAINEYQYAILIITSDIDVLSIGTTRPGNRDPWHVL